MAAENIMKLGFLLSATDKMTGVIDKAVKDSTSKLSAFEKKAQAIGTSMMKVGGAMTAAGVGLGTAIFASAKKVADYGDKILDASKKTGMGVEDLQKLSYAAERNGVGFDSFTSAITKLNKNIVDFRVKGDKATTIFKDLNIRTDNVKNTLLDTAKVFAKTADGPGKVAAAMELFGKAGADLIPFLNEGEKGITALMEQAEKMGLVLSTDAINAADNLDTALNDLKFSVTGAGRQIGSLLIPYVQEVTQKITGVIQKVVEWGRANPALMSAIVKVVTSVTGFLLVAGPLITAIGFIIKSVGMLGVALKLLAANPVGIIIVAIAAVVAGLIYLFKTNEKFRNICIAVWTQIKNVAVAIFGYLKEFWDRWGSTITEGFKVVFGLLIAYWKWAFNFIWSIVQPIFNSIKAFWDEWGGVITAIFKSVFGAVIEYIKMSVNVIMGVVKVFIKLFQGDWQGAWYAVKGIFVDCWNGMKAIAQKLNLVQWIEHIKTSLQTWFADLKTRFIEWGQGIIQGLVDGIKSMINAPIETIKNLGASIAGSFKNLLGISSPSKIFVEYGLNITQGLAGGIEKGTNATGVATQGLAMQTMQSITNAGATNTNTVSNTIDNSRFGGFTVNYNPTVNVTGGTGKGVIQELQRQKGELLRIIQDALANNRRLAFAD